jgi:hypothetical protein
MKKICSAKTKLVKGDEDLVEELTAPPNKKAIDQ